MPGAVIPSSFTTNIVGLEAFIDAKLTIIKNILVNLETEIADKIFVTSKSALQ
jgi:hypothetical protein